MKEKLNRSLISFSLMTLLSRILGYIRDMMCAYFFGASPTYDAFILAFRIPNLMRRLFAEGAFSQAFVPILSQYRIERKQGEVHLFISKVATHLTLAVCFITMLGILASNMIVSIFAPGLMESHTGTLASGMLKIMFPYMALMAMTATSAAILNSYGYFALPALTPVILNLCIIAAVLYGQDYFKEPIYALAWGVLFAGVFQWLFQWPLLIHLQLLPSLRLGWKDPGVRRVLYLMGPGVIGAAASQCNTMVDSWFASFLPAGSISWLYYSDRLMELPLGIFGVAFATVALPKMSRQLTNKDKLGFEKTIDWGIRSVIVIGVPATLGLCIMATPLLSTLFQIGVFRAEDVWMSRQALWGYAISLLAIMLVKILASAFFAEQNVRMPVKISFLSICVNIIANIILVKYWAHAGIAYATAVASWVQVFALIYQLKKRGYQITQIGFIKYVLQIIMSACLMSYCLWLLSPATAVWFEMNKLHQMQILFVLISFGIIIYGIALKMYGQPWIWFSSLVR